ncbi:ATP-binding sensor histidine kinase [Microcoleus sp. EPA2]|uniref:ATP-binding sensor histidine kinase n=1 Tax=Microcoleus sp. EPA2 TaxID=2841654 RepID=UPI00312B2E87
MFPASGFSGYELQEIIHQGAHTVIYRAVSRADGQFVILKVLNTDCPTLDQLARLKHEYQITQHLDCQHLIKVYGIENSQNCLLLILEDMGGRSLRKWMTSLGYRSNPEAQTIENIPWQDSELSLAQFLNIAVSLSKALTYIHHHKIIHKDIKPANIIINPETEQVKLTDFSIASRLNKEYPNLKNPDRLEGTLAYMSPEQTGRMNRELDYRSDFYSLGVTFYELLTKQLPFQSNEPLEMVHCHIAKQPTPIRELKPNIPPVIAQIVAKLMAKNAEDRYQSATGLLADLELCQNQIKSHGRVSDLIPGQFDARSQLSIPQKLYGREKQVEQLLQIFDRVSKGGSEIVMVSGYSGIGKSVLVQEIMRDSTRNHGYFISGKFDQFKRNIPYTSFNQAMKSLVNQILMESQAQLAQWRKILLNALGVNAQVAIDAIPELELILGPQPPVPELGVIESQNRFNRVMQQFIHAIATAEHPLILFLDDCQWIDAATVKMYQENCIARNPYLLVINAYRDGEISPTHPLMLANDALRAKGISITEIQLKPLTLYQINQLVSETLNVNFKKAEILGKLLLEKTGGNPFFLKQLLKSLHQDGLLQFNPINEGWQWNLQQIQQQKISENVVDLMIKKIQRLSLSSQRILQLAACIDNEFTLEFLSIASEQSLTETVRELWEALQVGLILPVDNNYRVAQVLDEQELEKLDKTAAKVRYKFLHDRVQQAAYVMIPDAQKQPVHLKLGRLLLQNTNEAERQEKIFDIVNHFNLARGLISSDEEFYQLAKLNLQAGNIAKFASAFEAAKTFFETGCNTLPASSWQDNYALTLELNIARGEAEYLNGNNDEALVIFDEVIPRTKTLLSHCLIDELKMTCLRMKNDLSAAYKLGVETLQSLGVEFEAYPDEDFLASELAKTKGMIGDRAIADLADLPLLTDPLKLAAHRILKELFPIAYFTNPNAQFLCAIKLVQGSVEHGNCRISAFGYTLYAFTLITKYREIEAGCAAGKLSLTLYETWNIKELGACIFHMWGALTLHYIKYIDECKLLMLKAFNNGIETGAYQWSGYASINYVWSCFFGNESLQKTTEITDKFIPVLSKIDRNMLAYHLLNKNAIAQLTCTLEAAQIPQTFIDDEALLKFAESSADLTTIFVIYLYKLTIANWFGDVHLALEYALDGAEFLKGGAGHFVNPVFRFHYAIALASGATNASDRDRQLYREQLNISLEEFRDLAQHCPANYQHKYLLIYAEIERLSGNNYAAAEYYDQSIASALENGFIQNAALANELATRFYLAQNRYNSAKLYLNDARFCYLQWGATAKVNQLEHSHPDWFQKISDNQITVTTTASTSADGNILDVGTVMKASQTISSEIVLEKLLTKLLHIILENAGAEKGAIILEKEGELSIEVLNIHKQNFRVFHEPTLLKNSSDLPISVIQYVVMTQKPILLTNAAKETIYQGDLYIQKNKPKSLLCAPILYQGKSIGVVYLENNLVVGAFTKERLKLLQILTAQAAIAIENARLYAGEQEKSRELKATVIQLQQTQAQLVQTEKISQLGQLVAGVAHEVNNPVGFISGNLHHVQEYIDDLINLLNLYQEKFPEPGQQIEDEIESIELEYLLEDLPKTTASMKLGIDRIRDIMQSLRNYSRTDTAQKRAVDIHEGIETTLMILSHRLKAKQARPAIKIIKYYGELPKLQCYPGQMNQVFMNLIANAIDALDESNVGKTYAQIDKNPNKITISTFGISEKLGQTMDTLVIRIADNGLGMPESVLEKLFTPFFTTKAEGEGTGLGLSICYQIVTEKHGGTLECFSSVGKGTEFVISIPM